MPSISVVAPRSNSDTAIRVATLLVVIWLVAMAQLLWHFEKQRIADSQRLLHFDVRDLPAPPADAPVGAAKVLYFFPETVAGVPCPCDVAALAEVTRLQHSIKEASLAQFVFAPLPASSATRIAARPLAVAERDRWQSRVPATAAAALWDAHANLIYFGPINVSVSCGSDGRSSLQSALIALRDTTATAFKSWDVAACICPASMPANAIRS